jgi:hypothetical protein
MGFLNALYYFITHIPSAFPGFSGFFNPCNYSLQFIISKRFICTGMSAEDRTSKSEAFWRCRGPARLCNDEKHGPTVDLDYSVMVHMQKIILAYGRNGRVHIFVQQIWGVDEVAAGSWFLRWSGSTRAFSIRFLVSPALPLLRAGLYHHIVIELYHWCRRRVSTQHALGLEQSKSGVWSVNVSYLQYHYIERWSW